MRLNLGCGGDQRPGWTNIDIAGGDTVHDLRTGLPDVKDVDYIYSSHFLEHLVDEDAINLLKSCYDRLNPGGTIRFCLPDFRKCAEAYLRGDKEFFNLLPQDNRRGLISFIEECAYQKVGSVYEHKALYDVEKLSLMLKEAGFIGINATEFNPQFDIDSEQRRRYSFYVEATKKRVYQQFMNGKNVLFAITVHDRLPELRVQETLIRHEFGKNVGLQVFCNCPSDQRDNYSGLLEDKFHWIENAGHRKGSLDHPNMVVPEVDGYDYIVLMAAKTMWTDYTLISKIITELDRSGKKVAAFEDAGVGHFKDAGNYGFFCDFLIFTPDVYKKVYPIEDDPNQFPEIVTTRRTFDAVGGKDGVFYIPCEPPGNTTDDTFNFKNIMSTNTDAYSIRKFERKAIWVSEKNPQYGSIINKLIRL